MIGLYITLTVTSNSLRMLLNTDGVNSHPIHLLWARLLIK